MLCGDGGCETDDQTGGTTTAAREWGPLSVLYRDRPASMFKPYD